MRGRVVAAFLGLVVGCGAAVVGRSALTPEASAQVGPAFKYRCVNTHARWSQEEVQNIFDAAGEAGWELATMTADKDYDYQACFKRRIR